MKSPASKTHAVRAIVSVTAFLHRCIAAAKAGHSAMKVPLNRPHMLHREAGTMRLANSPGCIVKPSSIAFMSSCIDGTYQA